MDWFVDIDIVNYRVGSVVGVLSDLVYELSVRLVNIGDEI